MKTLNKNIQQCKTQEIYMEQYPAIAKKWRDKREALETFRERIEDIQQGGETKRYEILQKHIEYHMKREVTDEDRARFAKSMSHKHKADALHSYREQKREELIKCNLQ